jgi:three-Cys-motif partner protein
LGGAYERIRELCMPSTDDSYWRAYDGLQNAKHIILRKYLGAWFPILASWNGKVLYIDCHAGRGRHKTGHPGSPLIALQLLLRHRAKDAILKGCEVFFVFFENNRENYDDLCREVETLGELPEGVDVHAYCKDYEATLRRICEETRSRGRKLAPSFAFVDPYGFTLSMGTLNTLLSFPASELLVNFMFRHVDMAIRNVSQEENMDRLFGTEEWRGLRGMDAYDERVNAIIALFSGQLKAEFVTHMLMRGSNKALKYVLFHASNHPEGRKKMKDAMWATAPAGDFTAYERDRPGQLVLLQPEPDLAPLRADLWETFAGQTVDMLRLYEWLLRTLYLEKHLHAVLRDYRNAGVLSCSGYTGRFAFRKNPTINFPAERPPEA